MRIAIVGCGYVGLVSGACFSEFGIEVACVDSAIERVASLTRNEIPIFEPGLGELVRRNREAGRLSFTTDLTAAVRGAAAVFIAVGTPSRRGDGHADLSHVYAAVDEIARVLDRDTVVVTKSTVPVGTGREVARRVRAIRPDLEFDIVSNPEFLREGSAIEDFMRPDRIVIGAESDRARAIMRDIYRPLFLIETPMIFTDLETAELIKYASNSFLAAKVAFVNEIADLCERVGADVQDVARGMGLDGRIGAKFLHAGPGFGGSCFPKDAKALIETARAAGTPLSIVETALAANDARKAGMAGRIVAACGGSVSGMTIAALGLTFKPNTDDMRDSPSLAILPALKHAGATLRAYDPEGMAEARRLMPWVAYCDDAYEAMRGADAVVIITEWNQFRALDLARMKALLRRPIIVDLRNVYRPADIAAAGFRYVSIGRAPAGRGEA